VTKATAKPTPDKATGAASAKSVKRESGQPAEPKVSPSTNKVPATDKGAAKSKKTGTDTAVKPVKTASSPQASAQKAEAVVSAPPVASGRSSSKISTSDNMPTTATKVDSKLANAWKTKAGRDLTEAELMAMPESEYMNDKQLDFFRGRLTALKEDLLSNAGETTEHLREDTSIVPDPADRATIEEEHALELRTRDRERKLLKKISQALAAIEAGEYGYCDETGEPIGLGRLIARPTANLSLEAQQRRELKQKMFGD